jgi:putative membrane protein
MHFKDTFFAIPWLTWLLPREPSVVDPVAAGMAAVLYLCVCRRHHVSWQRKLLFSLGLFSLYFTAQSRLDYYAEHSFLVRQIEDSFLHHAGPFLIAASRPGAILFAALPGACISWLNAFRSFSSVRQVSRMMNHPFVAVFLFCSVTVFWLIPRMQLVDMLDWRWNQVMNWSMVINGLMFWNLALHNHGTGRGPIIPRRAYGDDAGCCAAANCHGCVAILRCPSFV